MGPPDSVTMAYETKVDLSTWVRSSLGLDARTTSTTCWREVARISIVSCPCDSTEPPLELQGGVELGNLYLYSTTDDDLG